MHEFDYEKMRLNWNFKGNSKGYVFSVCKDIRTHYWRYPETPIIIHGQIEQNGLCREE